MNRRINIDRVDLDLRGIEPATAEAAVRLLGPALRAQFAQRQGTITATTPVDAERIASPGEPQALANRLAQHIAHRTDES